MNAEAITAKILEDARASAAETLKEADIKVTQMRQAAELEGKQKREEALKQSAEECGQLRDRMLRMAELDQRKELLGTKREVIDMAFEKALASMRAMPKDAMKKYLLKLLLSSCEGGEEIVVSAKDAQLFDQQMLKDINTKLFEQGKLAVSLSAERRETGGGFLLKNGGMEINCTFSAVLNQIRSSLEAEVAGILFR